MHLQNKEILTYNDTLPEQPSDEHSVSIFLRDFGGYNELFTIHQLFLSDKSTTLIVMDMTKPLDFMLEKIPKLGYPNTPAAVLHYWLNVLHFNSAHKGLQQIIALVLTHRDSIQHHSSEKHVESYINDILNNLQGYCYANITNNDNIYIVDNKSRSDIELEHLKNKRLQYLSQQSSWGSQMPVKWIKLKADMIEKVRKEQRRFLNLTTVARQAKQYGMNEKEIKLFLSNQNTHGHLIYYLEP